MTNRAFWDQAEAAKIARDRALSDKQFAERMVAVCEDRLHRAILAALRCEFGTQVIDKHLDVFQQLVGPVTPPKSAPKEAAKDGKKPRGRKPKAADDAAPD